MPILVMDSAHLFVVRLVERAELLRLFLVQLKNLSRLLRVQVDCHKHRHGDNYHLPHSIVVLIIDKTYKTFSVMV